MTSDTHSPTRALTDELLDIDTHIGYRLRIAQDMAAESVRRYADRFSVGRLAMMKAIHENDGLTQTELSQKVRRDKSTVTAAVNSLVKQGFILRERIDQRTYGLHVTDAGRAAMLALFKGAQIHDDRVTDLIGVEKKRQLIALLDDLMAAYKQLEDTPDSA